MSDLLTTVSAIAEKDYEITKDPFAIFSFALLVTTIFIFLFLLLVTARCSSNDIWDSMRHGSQRSRREVDAERAQEDAVPLMSSRRTVGSAMQHDVGADSMSGHSQPLKRVRFSEIVDSTTLPPASNAFDEVFDNWNGGTQGDRETRTGKRKSTSDTQLAELYLSSTS